MARDLERPGWVHWLIGPSDGDDFLDGAYWAASWAFERFFGDVLGSQLLQEVTQVQEYRNGQWVDLA